MTVSPDPSTSVRYAVVLLWLLAAAAARADSLVQLREESVTIPTCQIGPAQRDPIFYAGRSYQGAKGPVYPYPLLDKLTDQRVDKTYRAIYLENRYVQFSILPEIGGRIFTGCDVVAQRDDALLREIRLATLVGEFDRAIDLIERHHFHSWEGEGGAHDVYADAHLARAQQFSRQRRYQQALEDYEAALKYPENLESTRARRSGREVQIYCLMDKAREAMGDQAEARRCFQQAVAAWSDKADAQFGYWYALASRALGDEARATAALESLGRNGREMLAQGPPVDFFSKFGSKQSTIAYQASAHYLLGLGCLGQGRTSDAKQQFDEAVRIDPSHLGARSMAADLH